MIEQKDDIIDFSILFKRIRHPFGLLKRHFKLSVIYFIVAILLAIVLKFSLTPLYSGSFIIKSNETNDLYFFNMLNDLKILAEDKDSEGIAKELNISEDEASSIKKLNIIPISTSKDSTKSVMITFRMREFNNFSKVQSAIISYLENNEHYKKIKEIRLTTLDSLEKKIVREIIEMDSVKKIIIDNIKAPISSGNGLIYNVPVDPYKAYDINMGRFKEQLWLISKKKDTDSFELIKPCVVSHKPVFPKLSILLLVLLPLSFFVFIIHAYRKEKA